MEIFILQIVYVQQVLKNVRMLMFINGLKLMSACIAYITMYSLRWHCSLIRDGLGSVTLISSSVFLLVNTGHKLIFFARSESCLRTK